MRLLLVLASLVAGCTSPGWEKFHQDFARGVYQAQAYQAQQETLRQQAAPRTTRHCSTSCRRVLDNVYCDETCD